MSGLKKAEILYRISKDEKIASIHETLLDAVMELSSLVPHKHQCFYLDLVKGGDLNAEGSFTIAKSDVDHGFRFTDEFISMVEGDHTFYTGPSVDKMKTKLEEALDNAGIQYERTDDTVTVEISRHSRKIVLSNCYALSIHCGKDGKWRYGVHV